MFRYAAHILQRSGVRRVSVAHIQRHTLLKSSNRIFLRQNLCHGMRLHRTPHRLFYCLRQRIAYVPTSLQFPNADTQSHPPQPIIWRTALLTRLRMTTTSDKTQKPPIRCRGSFPCRLSSPLFEIGQSSLLHAQRLNSKAAATSPTPMQALGSDLVRVRSHPPAQMLNSLRAVSL